MSRSREIHTVMMQTIRYKKPYRLGTYSVLEWVLERYKERAPKDPTIREKFNAYRFAGYKEPVIDLLRRDWTVSVETMEILAEMPG